MGLDVNETDLEDEGTDLETGDADLEFDKADLTDAAGFLAGADGFLAGTGWATFFTTGLALLLAGWEAAFLAGLPADEWADFDTAFLAGTVFFTVVGFLAGFAAFFLVAILLGFFCNKHL
jgi:hypothetical protein